MEQVVEKSVVREATISRGGVKGGCISDKKEGIYREGYLMRLERSTRALSFPKDATTTSSLMVKAKVGGLLT